MVSTSSASRGYLTLAARNPRYLEMGVDMALSLRGHTELPIALAADEPLAELARTRYEGAFDAVSVLPERFLKGRALKYGTAEASPFEETIFVDADCIVLGSMDDLWPVLETADMAMTGEQLTLADDRDHHGFSTSGLIRRFELDSYLKTNSGLFCFRRAPGVPLMEECLDCYLHEILPRLRWSALLGGWLGDELAFGVVGGRRKLGTLPEPGPMYWPEEFPTLDLDRPTKALLHMLWPLDPHQLERLVSGTSARRKAAGLPGDGATHWVDETRRLGRLERKKRKKRTR